jgi:hypothetical protein
MLMRLPGIREQEEREPEVRRREQGGGIVIKTNLFFQTEVHIRRRIF